MVITENFRIREDGVQLVRTYSDINHKIIQNETGAVYDEAIDVTPLRYTYTESDEPIEEAVPVPIEELG